MQTFVRFFVERHLLVNVLAVATIVLGYFFIKDVPREYIPSIAAPIIYINASLPGASARDIETKITIPIEEAIQEVDGIDVFFSTISDNASFTTVELFIDFTPEQIKVIEGDLRQAIDGITDFPPEMEDEPTLEQFNPGKWPVVEVALAGPPDALIRAAKRLERKFERLDLVSRATVVGLQDPEVRILVDPVRASEHGITILDVVSAVRRRNVSSTGGILESSDNRKQVVVWSRFANPADVAETIVKSSPGVGTVRVRDIARVQSTREDTGLITHTNAVPGISIVIRKRENADAIDTVAKISEIMAQTPLPEGVSFELINDRSFYTRNRLELMLTNGLLGAVLVAGVLFLFMGAQPALWVVIGIPIVFMGALGVVGFSGMTLNLMSLTGFVIVLGMVVDDAVVVSENIAAHRNRGLDAVTAAISGASEMARPVVAAALTTIVAFTPMLAMGGLPGKIMWQLPAVVVIVLSFSLLESFCLLPGHMTSLKTVAHAGKRHFVKVLERKYRTALNLALDHRGIVVAIAFSILAFIMLVIGPRLPFVLFPQADARMLFVKISAPIGTPLEQTEAIATTIETQIQHISGDELRAVTARIGHQDIAGGEKERGEAENEALVTVIFKDFDRLHTNTEWIEIFKQKLVLPDQVRLVFQSEYIGPPSDQPVTIHLLSNDNETRRAAALEIYEYLISTPGLTEVEIDERPGTPQIDLNLNYEKLALLGLDPQDVSLTVQASFFGIEASEHRGLEETTALRVQFDPASRRDLQALLDMPVRAASGQLVRLRDVVNPLEVPAVNRIFHRDGFRATTVRGSFTPDSGHSAISFAQQLERELLPRFSGMSDLEILIGGEAEDTQETTAELGQAAILAVLGIGVIITILLGSFLEAMFVLVVIPFAIAGVFLAFFLHGLSLSMIAMMGAIGLCGVVVNASIVMVDSIHRRLKLNPTNTNERELILDAVVDRLRPVIVTTLTTLGGVLPTAYGIGGYDSMVSPMSIAIGWGLVFSTGVTLFLVPVLYCVARDLKRRGPRSKEMVSAVSHLQKF